MTGGAPRRDDVVLIVLGGFAGVGKTTLTRQLSTELGMPRLGSDTLGRTISASPGLPSRPGANPYWVAYDVLFRLCEDFLASGVSTMLDLSMGWAFQWERVDSIRARHPAVRWVPVLLRCPRDVCLARIQRRYAVDPTRYDPPELFATDPKLLGIWDFLEQLDRPDVHVVDAARPEDVVYGEVLQHVRRPESRWLPPETWNRLKAGVDCPMCADMHEAENPFSIKVADLDWSVVRLARNQYRRGWTLVILRRHASELFELGDAELAGFWREVAQVARALDRVYRPAKINYGVFGNLCPHIHCHLVMQFPEDDPTRPLDMQAGHVVLGEAEYAEMVSTLRDALLKR